MALHGCSEFTISGGQFVNVQGNLVQCMQQAEKEPTRWDDYRYIRTGDVYVTSVIDESEVAEYDETNQGDVIVRAIRHQKVRACRKINIAHIFTGDRFGDMEFLHVQYSVSIIVRDPYVAQLFGYNNNQNGLPALIFCNALIPLSHVILNNKVLSPVLVAYFQHQLGLWQPGAEITIGNLWIDSRSGTLCEGPQIQVPLYPFLKIHGSTSNSTPKSCFPALSIQTYRDTSATFDYLTRTVSTLNIIKSIAKAYRTFKKKIANEKAIFILTTHPGTIYDKHGQKIIARLPAKASSRLCYYLIRVDVGSAAMRESLVVMKDGSVRFTVTPMDIQHAKDMNLQYTISHTADLGQSWITQAHTVFSQFQIHKDKWEEYYMRYAFKLNFKCKRQHSRPQENTDLTSSGASVYLFIPPIPQPSDNEEIWRFWAEGKKYFWSSDPSGKEEMSEAMQVSLGLLSFTSAIESYYANWDQSAYEAIKLLHDHHHFDSTTTALAHSVGLSILEVVGDDDQFEVLDALMTSPKRRLSDSEDSRRKKQKV
ncbi:hypothetical protein Moror_16733 [Moniliophthora roreri MCA 2997]|uniref:Uncharacterized protein n=1 Tax=Moniliophthora roreri (strain MCA 2997) TaxID=1381753 RepID=V2W4P2_MONRO|nr:hypothetical protein Moror_16733 [Moniliophthora roreri MCA 2997]